MQWFISFIFLTIGCVFSHSLVNVTTKEGICLAKIDWKELWKKLENVNKGGLSQDCSSLDKSTLCSSSEMLLTDSSHKAAIALQTLNETAELFERDDVPFQNMTDFKEYVQMAHDRLKICLKAQLIHPLTDRTTKECFKRLEVFMYNGIKKCAWEIVHHETVELLKQLENYLSPLLKKSSSTGIGGLMFP